MGRFPYFLFNDEENMMLYLYLCDERLADEFNIWISVYEQLSGESVSYLADEVWQIARKHEETPVIENIYQGLLLSEIERLILDNYNGVEVEKHINARASSLTLYDNDGNYWSHFNSVNDFFLTLQNCQAIAA